MFGLLLRLAKAAVKKAAKKVVKSKVKKVKQFKKNPVKYSVKAGKKKLWTLRHPIKGVKKLFKGQFNRKLTNPLDDAMDLGNMSSKLTGGSYGYEKLHTGYVSEREKSILRIYEKSRVVEETKAIQRQILRGQSNAKIDTSEIVKDINKHKDLINSKTQGDLEDIEALIDAELKSLGIDEDNFDDIAKNKRSMFEAAKENAYSTHMEQWKTRFYASDTTDHLEEDEKHAIWDEIMNDKTYDWFVKTKQF